MTYEELLKHVVLHGTPKGDRTGTGTVSYFGGQIRYDLQQGFPLITSKKVWFKGVVHELLWFLSGDTNVAYLNDNGVGIWDEWAKSDGSLGPIYGRQWRTWPDGKGGHVDQISRTLNTLRADPDSRRLVVSAWNVAELDKMALSPCHCLFQFHVADGRLSCQVYQRSADMFLGVPFNLASYALLTHMFAQQAELGVGELVWTGGDCHVYSNHYEQVGEQLSRDPIPLPTLALRQRESIFDYRYEDVELMNYHPHPAISAPVAV